MLVRFDCDLSQDVDDPDNKKTHNYNKPIGNFMQGLNSKQKTRIAEENPKILNAK